MSVYGLGVAAYRSTAKWLVSLVPVAAIVAGGIALGPKLVDQWATLGAGEFFSRHWPALGGTLLIAVGLGLVVWQGAALLSKRAPDVTALGGQELAAAFAAGVAVPYFVDQYTYVDAQAQLTAWVDSKRVDGQPIPAGAQEPIQPDAEVVKALGGAVDGLREWALHRDIAAGFRQFSMLFGGGVLAMVVGLLVAAIDLAEPTTERRDPPVPVAATLTGETWKDMNSTLGCITMVDGVSPEVDLWLVAGDWEEPILQVDGDGCTPATDWKPTSKIAIRPIQAAE